MFGRPNLKKKSFNLFSLFFAKIMCVIRWEFSSAVSMFSCVCWYMRAFVVIFIIWSIKKSDIRRGRGILFLDDPGRTREGSENLNLGPTSFMDAQ